MKKYNNHEFSNKNQQANDLKVVPAYLVTICAALFTCTKLQTLKYENINGRGDGKLTLPEN